MLSGVAARRMAKSKLQELVVTDTIRATPEVAAVHNIRAIPIGPLIGEAIARAAKEETVFQPIQPRRKSVGLGLGMGGVHRLIYSKQVLSAWRAEAASHKGTP